MMNPSAYLTRNRTIRDADSLTRHAEAEHAADAHNRSRLLSFPAKN